MKLKNILLVVEDIEKSKQFYREIFGLTVVTDFGENVILTEGLVLQEQKLWEKFTERKVQFKGNDAELYFEENDMEAFQKKLAESGFEIRYVNPITENVDERKVIRIYDPDFHVIEIAEPYMRIQEEKIKIKGAVAKVPLNHQNDDFATLP